jgi:superfamily II DNA or RNA helicase
MNPRPYQQCSIDKIVKGFDEFDRQLLVLPTGGGKTLVFSWLAKTFLPKRTLILAHREELIDQAIKKLHAATGIMAQKEKAEYEATLSADVVVASVQTMMRRLDKWPAEHFGLVVADEAHHSISDSWMRVLKHFTGAKILGVTATPDRGDKKNLGQFYQNVAHEVPLFELINDGFLCPISVKAVPLQISLNGVKQLAGDYDAAQLGDALAPYMDSIAQAIKEHAPGRKTLVFLPLIATSKNFTDCCVKHGLNARHIDGYSEDRREILDAFSNREFDVLNNAMLLTEGYDDPSIDCVVVLRPTRSRPLFSQMVGRGTRICEGKKDLLLLDFLFIHEKHSLVRPASLIAKTDEEAEAMTEKSFEEAEGGRQEPLDLQGLASETQIAREKKLRDELAKKAKRKSKSIDPVEFALSLHDPALADYEPEMGWETESVSDKQGELLEKYGINLEAVTTRGMASKLLDKVIARSKMNLATPKQLKWLIRFKHPSPHTATFVEAGLFLDMRFGGKK